MLGHLPVFWVGAPGYLVVCTLAALAVYFTAPLIESRYRLLLWLDAVGSLSAYCVLGAAKRPCLDRLADHCRGHPVS